ncbi:MAG TPA: hypothetical protein VED41_08850 [Solirubrobacteraceae bacterium]|nr:hypothetical protein [Solirubrobacteraceae bacterium]
MSTIRGRVAPLSALAAAALALAACGGSSPARAPAGASTGRSATAATTVGAPAASTSAAASPAGAQAPGSVTVTRAGITASMRPHSHHPLVEAPWPISFTVTRAGLPVQASVSYEYLFDEQVVARRSHYSFHGHFADVFKWPAEAVGYPLTFRAVIQTAGTVIDLDYPVQVVR